MDEESRIQQVCIFETIQRNLSSRLKVRLVTVSWTRSFAMKDEKVFAPEPKP
jgi:hypothetical protein